MLAVYCSVLILVSLANLGECAHGSGDSCASLGDACAVLLTQGLAITCAVLMLQNVKLGFLVFLVLQGFEVGEAWLEAGDSADLLDLELLAPAAKALVTGFFLYGAWNT
jgi:hypothetical protein